MGKNMHAILATLLAAAVTLFDAAAEETALSFQRGINISMIFSFPEPSGWPPFRDPRAHVSTRELAALADAGFDFVRVPVDPTPFLDADPELRSALIDEVTDFIQRANSARLSVMIAGFPTDSETAWRPERAGADGGAGFEDYARWLEDIARAAGGVAPPGAVAIQLMNEPQSVCVIEEGTDWSEYQVALHARVRAVSDLPIVLTGGCWSTIEGLMTLATIPDDPATLFDVHYYSPFTYTHQGATWAIPILAYVGALQFPPQATERGAAWRAVLRKVVDRHPGASDEGERTARQALQEVDWYLASSEWPHQVAEDFRRLARWLDERGVARERLVLGEFGAIRPPDETTEDIASRQRYLRAVRKAAEAEGFGWAMWEYYAPFGLLESDETRLLSAGTLRALGLGE